MRRRFAAIGDFLGALPFGGMAGPGDRGSFQTFVTSY